jgi:hypothetical protein
MIRVIIDYDYWNYDALRRVTPEEAENFMVVGVHRNGVLRMLDDE